MELGDEEGIWVLLRHYQECWLAIIRRYPESAQNVHSLCVAVVQHLQYIQEKNNTSIRSCSNLNMWISKNCSGEEKRKPWVLLKSILCLHSVVGTSVHAQVTYRMQMSVEASVHTRVTACRWACFQATIWKEFICSGDSFLQSEN